MSSFYPMVGDVGAQIWKLEKKVAIALVRIVLERIGHQVEDVGPVFVPGFGTFYKKTRKSQRIRNPATGVLMDLTASWALGFRAAKAQKGKRIERGRAR